MMKGTLIKNSPSTGLMKSGNDGALPSNIWRMFWMKSEAPTLFLLHSQFSIFPSQFSIFPSPFSILNSPFSLQPLPHSFARRIIL
jgi:hypothetical protein